MEKSRTAIVCTDKNEQRKIKRTDTIILEIGVSRMKNEKGISKLVLFLIIAIIIAAALYWAKYFSRPMATVMMGGAEQAHPAIESARKAADTMNRATQATEEATRKASEDAAK
jgi:hypothetical protein